METASTPNTNRKKTIRRVAIGIVVTILGLYCFREQIALCVLNSTCSKLFNQQNTITEKDVEFYIYPLTKDISIKWKSEHNLDFENIGTGGSEGLNLLGVYYNKEEPLDINKARTLLIQCSSELLVRINEHEKLRPQLQVYPFTSKNLRFAISFRKDHDYPQKGKLAYISLYEGDITYFTKNPDAGPRGSFEKLHEETYEEALSIISQSPAPSTAASDSSLTASAD